MILRLAGSGIDSRTDVTPRTIVERLFLAPEQACIWIFVEMRSDQLIREWRKLFDTAYGNIIDTSLFPGLCECEIDLTCRTW